MLSEESDCDQYWSQKPLNMGFAETAVQVYMYGE